MVRSLFEPITINGMRLPNRVIRSVTVDILADESGAVTSDLMHVHVGQRFPITVFYATLSYYKS